MAARFFQFAFDFFASPDAPPPARTLAFVPKPLPAPAPTPAPVAVPIEPPIAPLKTRFPHAGIGFIAIEKEAETLGVVDVGAAALAAFRHPLATREAVLHQHAVAYLLERSRRKSIGFVIGPGGLAVRAPAWVSLREIDRAVQSKAGWIVQKLYESRHRSQLAQAVQPDWRIGASIDYLGEPVLLALDAGASSAAAAMRRPAAARVVPASGEVALAELQLAVPASANAGQIEKAVQAWLMGQAVRLFTGRLNHFAPQLRVQWQKLCLSGARTRWGSASSSGTIRLNWRLLHLPPELIDYVVVHELSHLRHMDHSTRFWATVAEVLPCHAALRKQLRQVALPAK